MASQELNEKSTIAKILRLLDVSSLDELKSIPIGAEPESKLLDNRNAFIDLVLNADIRLLLQDNSFRNQFLYPFILTVDKDVVFIIDNKQFN